MPARQRVPWQRYLDRSDALADADAAALEAEVAAAGASAAIRAPNGGDFKLSARPGDDWFGSEEAGRLASVVLSYQTPAGGWSKHTGYAKGPRQPGMLWSSQYEPGARPHYLATFDNCSTTEQLFFLAAVWRATGREDCKVGFIRGLDYILAAQYPRGGWPQVYPLEGGYHDAITLNDDVMTHILELLQAISREEPHLAFLVQDRREAAAAALASGIRCAIEIQLRQDGRPAAWCAQYDPLTLHPAQARAMEPPTLSSLESARLLKFLMTVPHPTPELVAAIEGGLTWLEDVRITGWSKTKRNGKTFYVPDPKSTEVYWARFYDIKTSQPVFPGRDGVLYRTFTEMAANNDLGYDYYTTIPGSVVRNGQKKWRKMLAKLEEPR